MANTLDKIKLSGVTYDIIDSTAVHSLDGYYTSGQTNDAITAATNALAETIAEQHYQTSGDVQNAISGKADTTAVTESINAATSGKLDTSVFNTYSGNIDTALASKVAGASWDSQTSRLNFYDNASATGTPLVYVDGADWVKDSFLKSVTVEDRQISGETVPCLVFVFDTESGETETVIPLTDIFDPSNYYTKTETDSAISAATSGKADTSAVTESINAAVSGKADTSAVTAVNDVLTAHTANTDIHVTTSDKTTWSGKQDALVSGTNIKTINGTSILGSGDISVQTLPTVSGTTLVFS